MLAISALDSAIARWSFGWVTSDQLPAIASKLVEDGTVSPSLMALACTERIPDATHHRLFEKALYELGRSRLTRANAGRIIAREYAQQIAMGMVAPVEGARLIWKVAIEDDQLCEELGIFGGRVSEYEGLPDGPERDHIAKLILFEAEQLLAMAKYT